MYFRDKNGKPIPKENFRKRALFKVKRAPANRKRSNQNQDRKAEFPVWAKVLIILSILSLAGAAVFYYKNRHPPKQKIGFNFY